MVDIDKFKALNDEHGHATGDAVLRGVAAAIVCGARGRRPGPVRRRVRGAAPNPAPGVAVEVGERIRAAVRGLDRELGVPAVSVSVGVAVAHGPDDDIASLLHIADQNLYSAKRGAATGSWPPSGPPSRLPSRPCPPASPAPIRRPRPPRSTRSPSLTPKDRTRSGRSGSRTRRCRPPRRRRARRARPDERRPRPDLP